MKRRRRCVRIEFLDDAGKIVDCYVHDSNGMRRMIVDRPPHVLMSTVWRAVDLLREAGCTNIRKVYEDAPREEGK